VRKENIEKCILCQRTILRERLANATGLCEHGFSHVKSM
jgi:uncharacterized Fe-S radical SAM superfamily protein PflX